MATANDIEIAKARLRLKNQQQQQQDIIGKRRALGQGLAFGWADELEASWKSLFGDKAYEEELQNIRQQHKEWSLDNPAEAAMLELTGAIPTAFIPFIGGKNAGARFLQAANAVKKNKTATAAAQGFVYGSGAAEGDLTDRVTQGAVSGAIGAGLGKVLSRTPEATALMQSGVELSPYQRNLLTKSLGTGLSKVPVIGTPVQKAWDRALLSFNTEVFNKALAPIGAKLPAGAFGTQAYNLARAKTDQVYEEILPNTVIKNTDSLINKIDNLQANEAQKALAKELIENIKNFGPMTGNNVKAFTQIIKRKRNSFSVNRQDQIGEDLRAILSDIDNTFRTQLKKENPIFAAELSKVDRSYGMLRSISNVVEGKSQASGAFGTQPFQPMELLAGIKRNSSGQLFARGKAPLQDFADDAVKALGQRPGLSFKEMVAGGIVGAGGAAGYTSGLFTDKGQEQVDTGGSLQASRGLNLPQLALLGGGMLAGRGLAGGLSSLPAMSYKAAGPGVKAYVAKSLGIPTSDLADLLLNNNQQTLSQ